MSSGRRREKLKQLEVTAKINTNGDIVIKRAGSYDPMMNFNTQRSRTIIIAVYQFRKTSLGDNDASH